MHKNLKYHFYVGWGWHGFFVKKSSAVFGFGNNEEGQLSLGDRKHRSSSPSHVKFFNDKELVYASLGAVHSLFFTKNGCFSCGYGGEGSLSVGDMKGRLIAVPIILEERVEVQQAVAGVAASYFLSRDGEVFSVGDNGEGALCLGDKKDDRVVGTKIRSLKEKVMEVVGGNGFVFFIANGNKIFGGGNNLEGQLGIGNREHQLLPIELTFFRDKEISSICCTCFSTFFLCHDSVYICGEGNDLAMGDAYPEYVLTPTLSKSFSSLDQIYGNSFIVWRYNSKFFGTGYNGKKENRFGLGKKVDWVTVSKEISFENVEDFNQTFCANVNTYFISKDGQRVAGCGNNKYGQLLNGSFDPVEDSVQLLRSDLDLKVINPDLSSDDGFGGVSKRVGFVVDLPKDLTISWDEKKLQLFSSMILPTSILFKSIQNGILKIENVQAASFDENIIMRLFFGNCGNDLEIRFIVDLFEFFSKLKLRDYEFCVLKSISRIGKLEDLIKLFAVSYHRFEKSNSYVVSDELVDVDNVFDVYSIDNQFSFESIFNVHLFNLLCARVDEIRNVPKYLGVLEKCRVWSQLLQYKKSPIEDSVYFGGCKKLAKSSDVFQNHCKELWKYRERTGNFIIVSKDEKEINVHKEIIIVRSDYFYRVVEFGGRETRREGFLCLERLDFDELMLIVEFIYTADIKIVGDEEELLFRLVHLLNELDPLYKDYKLRECIIEKMTVLTKRMIASGVFEKTILPEIGWLISDSPKTVSVETRQHFMRIWSKDMKREKLIAAIGESVGLRTAHEKDIEMMEMEKTLGKKVEGHSKQIVQLEQSMKDRMSKIESEMTEIQKGTSKIEKRMTKIEKGMADILKELKRQGEDKKEVSQRRSKRKRVKKESESDEEEERKKKYRKRQT